jgi:hypothetical protein
MQRPVANRRVRFGVFELDAPNSFRKRGQGKMKMTKSTPQFRHNFRAYVLSALALTCCITAAMPAGAQDAKSQQIKASSLAGGKLEGGTGKYR